jgi:hypothetical protein
MSCAKENIDAGLDLGNQLGEAPLYPCDEGDENRD